MTKLKSCPCGEIPDELIVENTSSVKYSTVCGTCCTFWLVEFRNEYETDPNKLHDLAVEAWNEAPRGLK